MTDEWLFEGLEGGVGGLDDGCSLLSIDEMSLEGEDVLSSMELSGKEKMLQKICQYKKQNYQT